MIFSLSKFISTNEGPFSKPYSLASFQHYAKNILEVKVARDLKFHSEWKICGYKIKFCENLLVKFIHHWNQLCLYRNVIHKFYELFDCASLDIDFSENLTLQYKEDIQSTYYTKKQLTVHSGILKHKEHKSYHIYVSDTRIHDQPFVRLSIDEMLSTTDDGYVFILIESDNCGSQYKSAEHFFDMQVIMVDI